MNQNVMNQRAHGPSRAALLDGEVITVRRLTPSDADAVVALYEGVPRNDRYLRFFTLHPTDVESHARSLTRYSRTQYAVGAFASGKLLGVANYVTCRGSDEAEVAVVVAHDQHMRGVGTALLRRLGEAAAQRGLHHLVADVLAENHPMLRLLTEAGWPYNRTRDGAVLTIDVDLGAVIDHVS